MTMDIVDIFRDVVSKASRNIKKILQENLTGSGFSDILN